MAEPKLVRDTGPVRMSANGGKNSINIPTRVTWDKDFEYRLEIGGYSLGFTDAILLRGIIDEYLRTDMKVEF